MHFGQERCKVGQRVVSQRMIEPPELALNIKLLVNVARPSRTTASYESNRRVVLGSAESHRATENCATYAHAIGVDLGVVDFRQYLVDNRPRRTFVGIERQDPIAATKRQGMIALGREVVEWAYRHATSMFACDGDRTVAGTTVDENDFIGPTKPWP